MRNSLRPLLFFALFATLLSSSLYFFWPSLQRAFVERALKEYVSKNMGYRFSYDTAEFTSRNTLVFSNLKLEPRDAAQVGLGTIQAERAAMYVSLNLRKRQLTTKLSFKGMHWTLDQPPVLPKESFAQKFQRGRFLIQPVVSVEGEGTMLLGGKELPLTVAFQGDKNCCLNLSLGSEFTLQTSVNQGVSSAEVQLTRFGLDAFSRLAGRKLKGCASGVCTLSQGSLNFEDVEVEALGFPLQSLQGNVRYKDRQLLVALNGGTLTVLGERALLQGSASLKEGGWSTRLQAKGKALEATLDAAAEEGRYKPQSTLSVRSPHFVATGIFSGKVSEDPVAIEVAGAAAGLLGLLDRDWTSKNLVYFKHEGPHVEGVLSTDHPVLSYTLDLGPGLALNSCQFVADEIPLSLTLPVRSLTMPLKVRGAFSAQGKMGPHLMQMQLSGNQIVADWGDLSARIPRLETVQLIKGAHDVAPILTARLEDVALTHVPTKKTVRVEEGEFLTTAEGFEFTNLRLTMPGLEILAAGELNALDSTPHLKLMPSVLQGEQTSLNALLSLFSLPQLPKDLIVTGKGEFLEGSEIELLPTRKANLLLTFEKMQAAVFETPLSLTKMRGKLSLDTERGELNLENFTARTNLPRPLSVGTNLSLGRHSDSTFDFWAEEEGRDRLRLKGKIAFDEDRLLFQGDPKACHLMRQNPESLRATLRSDGLLENVSCSAKLSLKSLLEDLGQLTGRTWDLGDTVCGTVSARLDWEGTQNTLVWSLRGEDVQLAALQGKTLLFRGDWSSERLSVHEFSLDALTLGAEFKRSGPLWKMVFMGGRFGEMASCGFEGVYDPKTQTLSAGLHMLDLELPLLAYLNEKAKSARPEGHFRSAQGKLSARLSPTDPDYSLELQGILRDFKWGEIRCDETEVCLKLQQEALLLSSGKSHLSTENWAAEIASLSYTQSFSDESYGLDDLKFSFDPRHTAAIAKDLGRWFDARIPQGILLPEGAVDHTGTLFYQKTPWNTLTKLNLGPGKYRLLGVPLEADQISFVKRGQAADLFATFGYENNNYSARIHYLDLICPYGDCEIKGPNLVGTLHWKTDPNGLSLIQNFKANLGPLSLEAKAFEESFRGRFSLEEYSGSFALQKGKVQLDELAFRGKPINARLSPLALELFGEPTLHLGTLSLQESDAAPIAKLFPFIDEESTIKELHLDNIRWGLFSQHALGGRGTLQLDDGGKKGGLTPKMRIDILTELPKLMARKAELHFHLTPQGAVLDSFSGTDKFRLAKMSFAKPGLYGWDGRAELSLLIEPKPVPFVKVYPIIVDYSGTVGAPRVKVERLDRPSD